MNFYAEEKLLELKKERLNGRRFIAQDAAPPRKPVFGPLAAGAGRTLRRLGERLESWANPPLPECDKRSLGYERR